jgi:hypothetical protein
MTLGATSGFAVRELGTLTAAGVGTAQESTGVDLTFQVVVINIGTNVVVAFEGSLDGVNYGRLSDGVADSYTITANGTYLYQMQGPVRFVRLRLVSLSGGSPSVTGTVGSGR